MAYATFRSSVFQLPYQNITSSLQTAELPEHSSIGPLSRAWAGIKYNSGRDWALSINLPAHSFNIAYNSSQIPWNVRIVMPTNFSQLLYKIRSMI
jgi:hypothetical protein